MDKTNRALRLEVQTLKRELYEARRQSAGWHAIVKIVNQYSSVPPEHDLISMAEIARLAGQSRATVGNWKARHDDFPLERARVPRGPLYSRAEVLAWLAARKEIPA